MRVLVALLLTGHGLVHAVVFGLAYSSKAVSDMPFDPGSSWLLGHARGLALALSLVVAAGFVTAGIGHVAGTTWWPILSLGTAVLSLALLLLFHSRYWAVGYLIDLVVVVLSWRAHAAGGGSA